MIEVAIADDHPTLRRGLKDILEKEIDISISQVASDGSEIMSSLRNQLPDILIMDMDMPGQSGISLLKQIKSQYPDLPVLILSVHPAERYAVRTLKAGSHGYINKQSMPEKLIKAIRRIVNQDRKFITDEVAEKLAFEADSLNNDDTVHKNLSDREYEILCKIAEGKSVEEISSELSISTHTIYTYRNRITKKTGLKSSVEMTQYALKNDLIDI